MRLLRPHYFFTALYIRQNRGISSFSKLGVTSELAEKLENKGISKPTQIQEKSLPLAFKGQDLVINAETGSGKTLCYVLPVVEKILKKIRGNPLDVPIPRPSTIIFAPTIELMYQIRNVILGLVDSERVDVCVAHKQSPVYLRKNTHVLITQPDYLMKYKLRDFYSADMLVFDEADLLITSDYANVAKIISCFTGRPLALNKKRTRRINRASSPPHKVQCLCIGATMPKRNRRSAVPTIKYCLPEVEKVESSLVHRGVASLNSVCCPVNEEEKTALLIKVISDALKEKEDRVLVFFRSSERCSQCYDQLVQVYSKTQRHLIEAPNVRTLYSDMLPQNRVMVIEAFLSGKCSILLTTDLASRGLDIPRVTVIQYDLAMNVADMLHRAGRTARAGREGKMISFVTEKETMMFDIFQDYLLEGKDMSDLLSRKQQLKVLIEQRSKISS